MDAARGGHHEGWHLSTKLHVSHWRSSRDHSTRRQPYITKFRFPWNAFQLLAATNGRCYLTLTVVFNDALVGTGLLHCPSLRLIKTIRRPVSATHEIIALYQEAGVLLLMKRSWKLRMFTGDEDYFQETAHAGAVACCIAIWSNLRHSASVKAEVAGAVVIRSPRTPDDSEMRQILWNANFRNLCIFVSRKTANIRWNVQQRLCVW